MTPAAPPARADHLKRAGGLLFLAAVLTILPMIVMTGDHLLHQKPGRERQTAVFAAFGLSDPCLFPSGHPARTRLTGASTIDWRPAASLSPSVPGPLDLIRPGADPRRRSANAR
jgi:hypothetical protein